MTSTPIISGLDALRSFATAPREATCSSDRAISNALNHLQDKRIGLITNHTGLSQKGVSTLEVLRSLNLHVAALFSPEHGLWGTREGDIESAHTNDGTPIHSLYGETRRPTDAMLEHIDTLLFDIQDVGARFYTYSTTLAYCMEECAARGISFVVLDRPNPLGGACVDGPLVAEEIRSFVGYLRVPIRHGMTLGELALWHRADAGLDLDLHIVPIANWRRAMLWPDTKMHWLAPSPNLPDFDAARWYPATCLLEFFDMSVGRGTAAPFQIVGAPWLDPERLLDAARSWPEALSQNITLGAIDFKPERAVFKGENCRGVRLRMSKESSAFDGVAPVALGMALLQAFFQTHEAHFGEKQLNASLPLLGSPRVLEKLKNGNLEAAVAHSEEDSFDFQKSRAAFLLYE